MKHKKFIVGYLVIGAAVAAYNYHSQGPSANVGRSIVAGLLWPATIATGLAFSFVKE